MAIVSGVGVGSGLDINGLVSQLVAAESATATGPINRREARAKAQISALGTIKSAFSTLKTAVDALKSETLFNGRKVVASSADYLTAAVGGSGTAVPGQYSVAVDRLASTHKLRSAEQPTATTLGLGTLKIAYGAGPTDFVEVDVTAENNTVQGLANAINSKAGGKGVNASVITTATGSSLVLTAAKSGLSNALTVTQTAGAGDLSDFTSAELSVVNIAQDSRVFVDGVAVTASSNSVTSAIPGLSLELKALTGANPATTLTVTEDVGNIKTALTTFVTAYNGVVDAIAKATAFDTEKKTAAALNGDSLVRGADQQLRSAFSTARKQIGDLGIDIGLSVQTDGKLKFDGAKFDAANAANPQAIKTAFNEEAGALYAAFGAFVDGLVSSTGSLTKRDESLNTILKETAKQRDAVDRRLSQVESRYRKQFVALDALLGKMNTTSQFLQQQLAGLAG